jgi:hypothetical protein
MPRSATFQKAFHSNTYWGSFGRSFTVACQWHRQGPRSRSPAMADTADTAQVIIRPPLAWGLAVIAGLALNWLMPLPFLPEARPAGRPGAMVIALALALVAWAIVTMTRAGSNVSTNLSTATIIESGSYRSRATLSTSACFWV